MAEFKTILKNLRTNVGLSQEEFAKVIGVGTSTIGMYESGKRYPTIEIEEKIADFFNVSIDTLRGKDESIECDFLLSSEEIEMIKSYRKASKSEKQILYRLIMTYKK